MNNNKVQTICERVGVSPLKPEKGSKLGIALSTIGTEPINGLRCKAENGTNGWYIWCGREMSEDPDFFKPLHVEHITDYLPQVLTYLDLPIGYRFLIDSNNYEDIWYDNSLFDV